MDHTVNTPRRLKAAQMTGTLAALKKAVPAPHPWAAAVQALPDPGAGGPAPDLAAARSRFLPFATAAAELAKRLRKEDPAFAGLKVYHCPMAPAPGLWMQTGTPLANPYFGAQMPTCGEDVAP